MTIQSELVEYSHDGVTFEGFLAWDDALTGPRPGVLVSHAWGGRSDFENERATALAELGYAGFALDLYGKGVRGTSIEENQALMMPLLQSRTVLQSRLAKSLTAMRSTEVVDQARSAIMGYCFGGLCALDLARVGTGIQGAISIHGLFTPPGNTQAISAKILALHGWDDPMAPPEAVIAFAAEMSEAGADWQLHAYGNTMHAFTNPQANDPEFGTVYNAAADRRSWQSIVNFLAEIF